MYTRSKYKSSTPDKTVARIESICHQIGIRFECIEFSNVNADHSCRLILVNDNLRCFNIGTNGKGMDEMYAKASAYGEFMERIQNKALFRTNLKYATKYFLDDTPDNEWKCILKKNNLVLDFLYYPDESRRTISAKEMKEKIIPRFFPRYLHLRENLTSNSYSSIFAPFTNLSEGTRVQFPVGVYRGICGTTGLCSGNTKAEAIIQGINEICERYVLQRLFLEKLELPEINLQSFKGTAIFERLDSLKEYYNVYVKDCSLGGVFPVIGLLLVEKNSGKYSFRLGADFSIITALERCFTETFQGKDADKAVFHSIDITNESDLSQYGLCKKNGTGIFPHCVLKTNDNKQQFPNIDFHSYEEELKHYITILKDHGYTVYCKDNSFLDFPAYSIYIPGLSEIDSEWIDFLSLLIEKDTEFNTQAPQLNIIEVLSADPNRTINYGEDGIAHLQVWNTSPLASRNPRLLKMLQYLIVGDYELARAQIEGLIIANRSSEKNAQKVYSCLDSMLQLLSTGNNDFRILSVLYGASMVENLSFQVMNPLKTLEGLQPPKCFNCERCHIRQSCRFFDVIALEKRIQSIQIKSNIYYGERTE